MRDMAAGVTGALARDNGAPVALRDIGMKEDDLERAADLAVNNPYWNPRETGPAQRREIRQLLQKAFEGTRPEWPVICGRDQWMSAQNSGRKSRIVARAIIRFLTGDGANKPEQ